MSLALVCDVAWPPVAMRGANLVQQNLDVGLEEALRNEMQGLDFARRIPHDVESRANFVERRKPNFKGE